MRILRIALLVVALAAIAVAAFVWASQAPVITGIERPQRSAFAPELIAKGAGFAAIGNCRVCHTAAGGAANAGGRPIPTPFGTIYSTNITPAVGNGIADWSEEAFRRAMRQGISRRGQHLYPAFPYDHFSKLDDDDLHALYAFIMTRRPVDRAPPENALPFPLNQRWVMALWNLFFLDPTPLRADPAHDAAWNRGRYLVDGLGHCGDCHTPRNLLGAEETSRALAGGVAEGWRAPALDAASPAPVPWDKAHLIAYLRHGWDGEHGLAAGPMREVAADLAQADAADLDAIATYLIARQGESSASRRQQADTARQIAAGAAPPAAKPGEALGAAIFAGACAACHTGVAPMVPPHGINLALSTAVSDTDPRNAINIVLDGIRPNEGEPGASMPGFAGAFTDDQLAQLLAYIRGHYSTGRAWPQLADRVRDIHNSARNGRKR